MDWPHIVSYFFGGVFFANAVPHFVAGVMGKPFQTPFAKPRGIGFSSSTINVLWACFNIAAGYVLVCRMGDFDLKVTGDVLPFGIGILVMSLFCARHFGSLHGGNAPPERAS